MKLNILITILASCFFYSFMYGQVDKTAPKVDNKRQEIEMVLDTSVVTDKPYAFVEQPAEFPGGKEAMLDFIAENLQYPKEAIENKIEGRVILRFVVEKDGSITQIEAVRKVGYGCAEAAIALIKKMPNWVPGQQHGQVVRQRYTLSVYFTEENMPKEEEEVVSAPDLPAEFPGGEQNLLTFLSSNITYPKDAREKGISGRAVARFIIEKDGSITNIEIVRSLDASCDAEFVRVIELMLKWIPGQKDGKIVRHEYMLPVFFKLSKEKKKKRRGRKN